MSILEHMPWEEIEIELFLIEVAHVDADQMIGFMESKGYKVFKKYGFIDILFAKNNCKK